ncbi:MAG: hypothetical protein WDW38_006997 [Sanguina aurantia]
MRRALISAHRDGRVAGGCSGCLKVTGRRSALAGGKPAAPAVRFDRTNPARTSQAAPLREHRDARVWPPAAQRGQRTFRARVAAHFAFFNQCSPAAPVLHDAQQAGLGGVDVLRQHGGVLRDGWMPA